MFCPLVVKKSLNYQNKMIMQGIASTRSEDLHNQILSPEGADLDYFLNYGEINFDHIKSERERLFDGGEIAEHEVGYPIGAFINGDGALQVEFGLFENKEISKHIYNYALELEKTGSKKKLGLSVEALPNLTVGNEVKKWTLTGLAITPQPVNGSTSCIIKKSLSQEEKKSSYDYQSFYQFAKNNNNNNKMDMKKKLAELFGNNTELTAENIATLENEIAEAKKQSLEMSDSAESRLLKSINAEIEKSTEQHLDKMKSVEESLEKNQVIFKSLQDSIQNLKESFDKIDNTPIAKATEVMLKSLEGDKNKEQLEKEGEEIEITLDGTEEARVLYKSLLDALVSDNEITKDQARQYNTIYSAQGTVKDAVIDSLKKQQINLVIA